MKKILSAALSAALLFTVSLGTAAEELPTDVPAQATSAPDFATENSVEGTEGVTESEEAPSTEQEAPVLLPEKDSQGETTPKSVNQQNISFDIAFTGGADCAVIGDTLWTEVTFPNYGDDFTAEARWLMNGQPIENFTNREFFICDGKTSAFPKLITEDFWDWGEISIGFEILIGGESFYKIERRAEIRNVPYAQEKIDEVLAKVKPVKVEAWLNKTAPLYTSVNCTTKKGTVTAGTKVICLGSKTDFSNYISLPNGDRGWVRVQDLNISQKNYTQTPDLSNWDKNIFVNAKGYRSDSEYLVWVNLAHQRVNVFKGSRGKWSIEGAFPCATGLNATPTITGEFKYYARDAKWTYPGYYVGPCLIFSGNYALHSVLLSDKGGVYDGTLGRPASHGCVRLAKHHIDWLDQNIPLGTTVVVY